MMYGGQKCTKLFLTKKDLVRGQICHLTKCYIYLASLFGRRQLQLVEGEEKEKGDELMEVV